MTENLKFNEPHLQLVLGKKYLLKMYGEQPAIKIPKGVKTVYPFKMLMFKNHENEQSILEK
jgi:hypothetical protein